MAVVETTPEQLEAAAAHPGLLLVACRAANCGACHQFEPTFERVAARHPDHTFARLDVMAEEGLSEALGIEHTPTLMVYRDGILLFRQAGNFPLSELEDIVTQAASLDMDVVRSDLEAERTENSNTTTRRRTMMTENAFKKELSVKWIKAKSGKTYLCPVDSLRRVDSPSEDDLKRICVDESDNPHND